MALKYLSNRELYDFIVDKYGFIIKFQLYKVGNYLQKIGRRFEKIQTSCVLFFKEKLSVIYNLTYQANFHINNWQFE